MRTTPAADEHIEAEESKGDQQGSSSTTSSSNSSDISDGELFPYLQDPVEDISDQQRPRLIKLEGAELEKELKAEVLRRN